MMLRLPALILAGLLLASPPVALPALAGPGASAWSEHNGAALRLLDAGRQADGIQLAGIELRVPPGFKTYWRSPGDSGVPPVVSVDRSENVASVEVLYPAPVRFDDGAGGYSWGYPGDVVFPVRVRPADPDRSARLAVSVDYAVCAKICIPVHGEAVLELAPGPAPDPAMAGRVGRHLVAVPARKAAGEAGPLGILALRAGDQPDRLVLDVRAAGIAGLDVFIETPSGWFIEAGSPELQPEGRISIPAKVVERPREPSAVPVAITITLVAPSGAIEVPIALPPQ